jgi:hypothetical protein
MATGGKVLEMLCPDAGWTIYGDEYDSIVWESGTPAITKKQFTDGFAQYDAYKAAQDAAKVSAKETAQAKLAALGLTVEDLQALGL